MSTPKRARQYRRPATGADRTKNHTGYRVTASWDTHPDRPAIRHTTDKRKARRIADEYADQGAYVVLDEHTGYGAWRTIREYNGPALLAEAAAVDELHHAGYPPTPAAYRPDADDRHRTWLQWMTARAEADRRAQADADTRRRRLAAEATTHARELMQQPPHVRDRAVRHITGGQR
ncbi:hypothetical protein PV318_03165 [Streptomyces sp. ME02-6991-2B]|nr:hypothetical protein [Streptomyces sp. ME02-6991-2B]